MTSDTESSDNDLHIAVRYGDIKQVQEALKCRLSPNQIGLYQWSPLHEASSNGHNDIVRLLLKHGGNPNKADRLCANTAVHYAAVEGHPTCLRLLIEAGGDYSLTNNDGETAFDMATRACERVIEKKRVEELIRMPLREAKQDAEVDFHRIEAAADAPVDKPASAPQFEDIDIVPIDSSTVPQRVKAWSPQITKHDPATMGTLHMSFEYNSKKSYLKIRLWKLTGLLISENHSTMINTLYIKSSFLPDAKKVTKRKSEEIKISSLFSKQRKPTQPYVTETGSEVLFEPVTFKFSKPLVYEPISCDDIQNKVVYIQVSLRQKYTQRTYKIADLTIPLQVAVTRIVKEAFPLRICTQTKLPESMMILADTRSRMSTASDPNLRQPVGTPLRLTKSDVRPASDVNLREVLSVSSQSPSVSIGIPSDDEAETSNEPLSQAKEELKVYDKSIAPMTGVTVEPPAASDVVVAMPGAIEDVSDDENKLHTIVVESSVSESPSTTATTTTTSTAHHIVRVVVTNEDSDSNSDDQLTSKPRSKLSSLFSKHSTNQVIELESGQGHTSQGNTQPGHASSVTDVSEIIPHSLTKHKLKPKLPQVQQSNDMPAHSHVKPFHVSDLSTTGNDVVLSLGDLELEDFEEPTKVHTACKKITDEQMV